MPLQQTRAPLGVLPDPIQDNAGTSMIAAPRMGRAEFPRAKRTKHCRLPARFPTAGHPGAGARLAGTGEGSGQPVPEVTRRGELIAVTPSGRKVVDPVPNAIDHDGLLEGRSQ